MSFEAYIHTHVSYVHTKKFVYMYVCIYIYTKINMLVCAYTCHNEGVASSAK